MSPNMRSAAAQMATHSLQESVRELNRYATAE
jgi:hypothetical protein